MAPRGPQKGQKSILMGSLVVLDPNASPKKILSIFGTGCHKVCTCPLNGALLILVLLKNKHWLIDSILSICRTCPFCNISGPCKLPICCLKIRGYIRGSKLVGRQYEIFG